MTKLLMYTARPLKMTANVDQTNSLTDSLSASSDAIS